MSPGARLIARPEARRALRAWLDADGTLIDAAAARPGVEPLKGRGRVYRVPAPTGGGHWVVRHYHRGGAIASLLGDRYLRLGAPRPFREFRLGRALEELEVPTPPHVGAAVYPAGPWYRGDLVTRYIPRSRDLAAVLFPGRSLDGEPVGPHGNPDTSRRAHGQGVADGDAAGGAEVDAAGTAMEAAGALVRLLHDRGVSHPDLNLKNILVADGEPVRALVLDLDRAVIRPRLTRRARHRMLSRFWRSARKWEERTGRTLAPSIRDAFGAGYAP